MGILPNVVCNSSDYLSRKIDRIIVDIKSTFNNTATTLSKNLANEGIFLLDPIIKKHKLLNEVQINALKDGGQGPERTQATTQSLRGALREKPKDTTKPPTSHA